MNYITLRNEAGAELVEKKSRFIAKACPVSTEQEALDFLENIRAQNRTASHNVFAYRLRERNLSRYSDDGEPSGTAGLPVLDILERADITDAIIVVTRYFGGIMLGALFIDDASKLSTQQQAVNVETGKPVVDDNGDPVMIDVYENTFEAYKANSPKHEIYLAKNQAITFQLTAAATADGTKAWIGLSAPDAGKNTGTVTINTTSVDVTSGVDMYYPIPAGATSVTITNTGDNLISVTNLKITGSEAIYNAANAAPEPEVSESPSTLSVKDAISMVFEPVTTTRCGSHCTIFAPIWMSLSTK